MSIDEESFEDEEDFDDEPPRSMNRSNELGCWFPFFISFHRLMPVFQYASTSLAGRVLGMSPFTDARVFQNSADVFW